LATAIQAVIFLTAVLMMVQAGIRLFISPARGEADLAADRLAWYISQNETGRARSATR
jgi:hypothetical protein